MHAHPADIQFRCMMRPPHHMRCQLTGRLRNISAISTVVRLRNLVVKRHRRAQFCGKVLARETLT